MAEQTETTPEATALAPDAITAIMGEGATPASDAVGEPTTDGTIGATTVTDSQGATVAVIPDTTASVASAVDAAPRHVEAAADVYTPAFSPVVRTVVYVVCLLAGVASIVLDTLGYAQVGGMVATCASILAAGFGVAYNPLRS